jgi:hypothetical protein
VEFVEWVDVCSLLASGRAKRKETLHTSSSKSEKAERPVSAVTASPPFLNFSNESVVIGNVVLRIHDTICALVSNFGQTLFSGRLFRRSFALASGFSDSHCHRQQPGSHLTEN